MQRQEEGFGGWAESGQGAQLWTGVRSAVELDTAE